MGRECRRVPKDWKHPKNKNGIHIPLLGRSFSEALKEYKESKERWDRGQRIEYNCTFNQYYGPRPIKKDYMPDWTEEEKTHYQMYEDTSEGTPISPVMETPEELARWLVDNKASYFADMVAPYEKWLDVINGGFGGIAIHLKEKNNEKS